MIPSADWQAIRDDITAQAASVASGRHDPQILVCSWRKPTGICGARRAR